MGDFDGVGYQTRSEENHSFVVEGKEDGIITSLANRLKLSN